MNLIKKRRLDSKRRRLAYSMALLLTASVLLQGGAAVAQVHAPGEKLPPVEPTAKSLAAPTQVPPALQVPSTSRLSLGAHAVGVQIYVCQHAADDPLNFSWVLKGPEATLQDATGVGFGKHYAGPTWEYYDGSRVVGTVVAKYDADGASIPWLLLTAKATNGDGGLSAVQYIQRLHTSGGKAPERGCDKERDGTEVRIDYTADYYFYVAT